MREPTIKLVCEPCARRGRYNVEGFIAKHGADMRLPELRMILAKVRYARIPLKNSVSWRRLWASGAAVSGAKLRRPASCGEDRLREGDELRQFPQILGGGG